LALHPCRKPAPLLKIAVIKKKIVVTKFQIVAITKKIVGLPFSLWAGEFKIVGGKNKF
jgi:hypothetical protein